MGQNRVGKYIVRAARSAIAALFVLCALYSNAGASNLYGLIIGIDDYLGTENDLQGAVNDARDLAQALHKAGAKEVHLLLDRKATKSAITRAWYGLVAKARQGDTIILTYSGHGSQEPEPKGRGGEVDGLNENFLLANFSIDGPGLAERIVDDEIFAWLMAADQRGINVIFVADSCHSGTMFRALPKGGRANVRYRGGRFRSIPSHGVSLPPENVARVSEADLRYVTFIGATTEDRLTPEVKINGKWRGALSWSIARALEGFADKDRDGAVTQYELLTYIIPTVHGWVESQQTPQIRPARARDRILFHVRGPVGAQAVAMAASGAFRSPASHLRLKVIGPRPDIVKQGGGVEFVAKAADADLLWDANTRTLSHRIGGVVGSDLTDDALRGALAKWSLVKRLRARAAYDALSMDLPTGTRRYRKGDIFKLRIAEPAFAHLTLFNLAPYGRIEVMAPLPGHREEAAKDWRKKAVSLRFRVQDPPFGAEHLVAIFSERVLVELHEVLRNSRNVATSPALAPLLNQLFKEGGVQVGVADIYTGDD